MNEKTERLFISKVVQIDTLRLYLSITQSKTFSAVKIAFLACIYYKIEKKT